MYYRGLPIKELTKGELIVALEESFDLYCKLQSDLKKAVDILAPHKDTMTRGIPPFLG